MRITTLTQDLVPAVKHLIGLGAPYLQVRTDSDYWLYARLFSPTCLVALGDDDEVLAAVIAFRSQNDPGDIYVQDVATHPRHRQQGTASRLLTDLADRARNQGCSRIYLTSEPENEAAHAAWLSIGFVNLPGDRTVHGVSVMDNYKGPGKHRAVYALQL